jgi:hypothetical protein
MGTPRPDYHDLRACALARVGRACDAAAELQAGQRRLFAAEAHLALGALEQARECAVNAYRWAWRGGPPHVDWYYLKRSRAVLEQLREPEPRLAQLLRTKVARIPFEKDVHDAITRLNTQRARQTSLEHN